MKRTAPEARRTPEPRGPGAAAEDARRRTPSTRAGQRTRASRRRSRNGSFVVRHVARSRWTARHVEIVASATNSWRVKASARTRRPRKRQPLARCGRASALAGLTTRAATRRATCAAAVLLVVDLVHDDVAPWCPARRRRRGRCSSRRDARACRSSARSRPTWLAVELGLRVERGASGAGRARRTVRPRSSSTGRLRGSAPPPARSIPRKGSLAGAALVGHRERGAQDLGPPRPAATCFHAHREVAVDLLTRSRAAARARPPEPASEFGERRRNVRCAEDVHHEAFHELRSVVRIRPASRISPWATRGSGSTKETSVPVFVLGQRRRLVLPARSAARPLRRPPAHRRRTRPRARSAASSSLVSGSRDDQSVSARRVNARTRATISPAVATPRPPRGPRTNDVCVTFALRGSALMHLANRVAPLQGVKKTAQPRRGRPFEITGRDVVELGSSPDRDARRAAEGLRERGEEALGA